MKCSGVGTGLSELGDIADFSGVRSLLEFDRRESPELATPGILGSLDDSNAEGSVPGTDVEGTAAFAPVVSIGMAEVPGFNPQGSRTGISGAFLDAGTSGTENSGVTGKREGIWAGANSCLPGRK